MAAENPNTLPTNLEAASGVLQFPTRNRSRIRKSRSPEAMGRCSIGMLEHSGESIPANVADIRSARQEPGLNEARAALRLAAVIYGSLEPPQKESIRKAMRFHARHTDGDAGDDARALYRLLTGEALQC